MSETTGAQNQAQVGALLESHFKELAAKGESGGYQVGSEIPGLEGYEVLEVGTFDRGSDLGGDCFKAITVRDPDGNIYVHFNGTGDGNWVLNAAAYSEEASRVQEWAREYCDHTILENYILNQDHRAEYPDGSIYLTGHSQGGNNAQYAMLTTKYADYVDTCVSLDGPGFSHDVVSTIKENCGSDYDARVDKIYAYNGSHDFVSPLGQEQVVRDDHSYFVIITDGYNRGGKDDGFASYHMVEYMLNPDGTLGEVRRATDADNGESAFRKMIRDLNDEVNRLPPGKQKEAAIKTMKVIEYFLGSKEDNLVKGDLSVQDVCQLIEMLIPILISTAIENPGDLIRLLAEKGVFGPLSDLIGKYPIIAVVLVLIIPGALNFLFKLGISVVAILALIDAFATVIDKLITAWNDIREFCKNAFEAIKRGVKAIKDWARNTFNRGVGYVKNHPSFSADPDKLRRYASRVASVNRRLRNLDGMLDSLYWQVGFFDLGTIMDANLLTSGSPTLTQIQHYLEHTAERLETAEAKAKAYMGG